MPLSANLKLWLAPRHQPAGKVVPFKDVSHQLTALAAAEGVGLQWKRNGLRHSFISYRVSYEQTVSQVALEVGSSPQIIYRNYRELVKPADVIALPSAAATRKSAPPPAAFVSSLARPHNLYSSPRQPFRSVEIQILQAAITFNLIELPVLAFKYTLKPGWGNSDLRQSCPAIVFAPSHANVPVGRGQ